MNKHNILFILPWLPYPLKTGGHQAIFNGIDVIKDMFNIHITYEVMDNEEYREAEKLFLEKLPNVKILPLKHKVPEPLQPKIALRTIVKNRIKKILHIKNETVGVTPVVSRTKDIVTDTANSWKYNILPPSKEWSNHIYYLCKAIHFDIIQVEMPRMLSNIFVLPQGVKKVFVHHELGFVRREQEYNGGINSPFAMACKAFADLNEINQLNLYDAIITLSDIDKKKLCTNGVHKPIYSSFAIVNTANVIYCPNKHKPIKKLTFIGSGGHEPNRYGLTWFLDKCWPLLKEKDSEYTLDIIGNWNEEQKNNYIGFYDDINFLGFIDNISDVINKSVMIVPITVGSGIRMKILEAVNNDVAFVSTSIGAEGLPFDNGRDCVIADKPLEFVNGILKLQDTETYYKMTENARKKIKDRYSMESLMNNRLEIYSKICIQ